MGEAKLVSGLHTETVATRESVYACECTSRPCVSLSKCRRHFTRLRYRKPRTWTGQKSHNPCALPDGIPAKETGQKSPNGRVLSTYT